MQKFEYRCSLEECTVSLEADRSERSEDKKGRRIFGITKYKGTTSKFNFTTTGRALLPIRVYPKLPIFVNIYLRN